MNSEIVKSLDLRHFESCILHIKCKFYEEVPNLIGYEKPIIYLGGEYIGYRVKDNEKLAPDDNELCPVTKMELGNPVFMWVSGLLLCGLSTD